LRRTQTKEDRLKSVLRKIGWGGRIRKLTASRARPLEFKTIQCFQQFTPAIVELILRQCKPYYTQTTV
jgi:hypothetical protein